ncbi:folate-binding protein YgfZ [Nitratireductor mangrovi]|uniref:Folate-binding protein YgfZ n=1 Tax=Nitratireductor mangrovi TaxID=2599600 RepID=A0A5B8KTJ1_9HYPH|nr:folate-binding protein YgfZ [Nitratireductor mangrovi]QDY98901.1 folate-binding protein YgfZ [Nitratireductor mangrovi]
MPSIDLPDRAIISVSGPDAEHLLQNILTTDLGALGQGEAKPGALLTPQGKILFDFMIVREGADGFLIECRSDIAEDFRRRLRLYKLRAKADITTREQSVVSVSWQNDSDSLQNESGSSQTDSASSQPDSTGYRDTRFPEALAVQRSFGDRATAGIPPEAIEAWTALRVAHGVAESGSDYELGDAFPHDVLLDQNGGLGLKKGCYVGQEVVSRMQHRGTARRRVLIVKGETALPAPGTAVTTAGRAAGTLGTVAGKTGLAILRIDRVKEAIDAGEPVLAGDVPVTASIPPGARFGFPQAAAGEAGA